MPYSRSRSTTRVSAAPVIPPDCESHHGTSHCLPAWLTCLVLLVAAPAGAFDLSSLLSVHGYGGWSYGSSDGNEYLGATEDGEYDSLNFALNLAANPTEKYSFHAQVEWLMMGEEEEAEIDFVFAEYRASDLLGFRIGKVKQPFGIYTEFFDVGTARPFYFLPQGIYGPNGNVAEAYLGLGITGMAPVANGWQIGYDAYAGELQLPFDFQLGEPEGDEEEEEEEEEETEDVGKVLGGRVELVSPSGHLRFGLSASHGEEEEEGNETLSVLGAHFELDSDRWALRTEITRFEEGDRDLTTRSAYVELAFSPNDRWQIATRYDWSEIESPNLEDLPPSLLEHEDRVLALGYWFNSQFVLRLELHLVEGNRFALPEGFETDDLDDLDDLETDTEAILFGGQFSF